MMIGQQSYLRYKKWNSFFRGKGVNDEKRQRPINNLQISPQGF